MNKLPVSVSALLGAALPFLLDSALKGIGLLALAGMVALLLLKASAATRHLVWVVAVSALLVLPVLSALLPDWRVLPGWVRVPGDVARPPAAAEASLSIAEPEPVPPAPHAPEAAGAAGLVRSVASVASVASTGSAGVTGSTGSAGSVETPVSSLHSWQQWLPLLWGGGVVVVAVRLLGACWMARRSLRGCTPIGDGPLRSALERACGQLDVRQRVELLLDPGGTIPVVWGVFRPRVLLPSEALNWDEGRVRSVLLHEVAHVRRRDIAVQWLAQAACAVHWFNPLVWVAAWRLRSERERACDDLVLASGVRPSEYAEHLLEVATRFEDARWIHGCGVAMARPSHIEGRLLAVLSEKLNRRRVTTAFALAALVGGAAIAVPIAMLRAADEPGTARERSDDGVRRTGQAGTWSLAGGVTMQVSQEIYHGADVTSWATLGWPETGNRPALRHEISLASDAFGNRHPWKMAWEPGVSALWIAVGEHRPWKDRSGRKHKIDRVRRVDFSDPVRIVETHWIPAAPLPAGIRAAFETEFELPGAGGRTEQQEYVHSARLEHTFVVAGRTRDSNGQPLGQVAIQLRSMVTRTRSITRAATTVGDSFLRFVRRWRRSATGS